MHRVHLSFLLFVLLLIISACSSNDYESHLQLGKEALTEERYEDAVVSFKEAAKEDNTDEVQQYITVTTDMIDSLELLEQGEFSSVILTTKKMTDIEEEDEVINILKSKAITLQKEATTLDEQYQKALYEFARGKLLLEQNHFDDAYSTFELITKNEASHSKLEKLTKEANDLMNQTLEKKNIFLAEQKEKEEAAKKAEEERLLAEKKSKEEQEKQKKEQEKSKSNQKVSKDQAVANVREYLNLKPNPNLIVEYDHDNENGDYVIHVYEVVIDNPDTKEGHTATWGWYGVDPNSGFVYDAMAY